jgi:SSU ribosomal protein S19E
VIYENKYIFLYTLSPDIMTTPFDTDPNVLTLKLAEKLKGNKEISIPEWAKYVKTGIHKEKGPEQKDWWHIRAAAILRKLYVKGPLGVEKLRSEYGGKRDRGSKRYKARKGSGAIIREVLNQLESAGFVSKEESKGRVLTSKGRAFLDKTSYEVAKK